MVHKIFEVNDFELCDGVALAQKKSENFF